MFDSSHWNALQYSRTCSFHRTPAPGHPMPFLVATLWGNLDLSSLLYIKQTKKLKVQKNTAPLIIPSKSCLDPKNKFSIPQHMISFGLR